MAVAPRSPALDASRRALSVADRLGGAGLLGATVLLVLTAVLASGGSAWSVLLAAATVVAFFGLVPQSHAWTLPRMSPWLALTCVLMTVVAVGLPTLACDFLGDDFGFIRSYHARALAETPVLGDVTRGIWGIQQDEMRPLFVLSLRLNAVVFGVRPEGFHAVNVCLQVLAAFLIYGLTAAVTGSSWTSLCAALLFGLAPVQAETVCWITGRVDALPTIFYLTAVLMFARFRANPGLMTYTMALVALALGLFCKEILITLPLTLVAYDILVVRPCPLVLRPRPFAQWTAIQAPFALLVFLYLALRRFMFGNLAREGRLAPAVVKGFIASQLDSFRFLVPPFDLTLGRHSFPGILPAILGGTVLGAVCAALVALLLRRARFRNTVAQVFFFAVAWFGITALPLIVTYPSPRHLYLPSCGPAIALALLLLPVTDDGVACASAPRLLGVVLLLTLALEGVIRHDRAWIEAGRVSYQARTDLDKLSRLIPVGSTVILSGVPNESGETTVWDFALPFAMEPPFVSGDLYGRLKLLEHPSVYCCPMDEWWTRKRPIVLSLLAGPPQELLELYSLHWNPRRLRLLGTWGRVTRGDLRSRLEAALRRPVDPAEWDSKSALEFFPALADAVRQFTEQPLPGAPTLNQLRSRRSLGT